MNENTNNEVEQNSSSNANQIYDLIQSIQSKLNNEKITPDNINNNENTDLNTNQDNNNNNNNNNNLSEEKNKNDSINISSLLENIDLSSILGSFSNQSSNVNNNSNFGNIDPSTMMKFGNIFSSVTRNNPKKNLLLSLKPFLRKTRQDKINEYITMLTIVDAIGIFNSKGSD